MLTIENEGPEIVASNYWETEYAKTGAVYLSVNAGAFRLLLPPALEGALAEMRQAREAIISRGPWPETRRADAIEVLFEDGSDTPFALFFGLEQIDRLPASQDEGRRDLRLSVWTSGPTKALELPASYRRAPSLPWLKAWPR